LWEAKTTGPKNRLPVRGDHSTPPLLFPPFHFCAISVRLEIWGTMEHLCSQIPVSTAIAVPPCVTCRGARTCGVRSKFPPELNPFLHSPDRPRKNGAPKVSRAAQARERTALRSSGEGPEGGGNFGGGVRMNSNEHLHPFTINSGRQPRGIPSHVPA
jgi:hypothetical protein